MVAIILAVALALTAPSTAAAWVGNETANLTPSSDGIWRPIVLTGRAGHTATYDPVRHRMIVFGGLDVNVRVNEVWSLSLDASPKWMPLIAAGTPPPARYAHTAIYDPVRDRLIVFGGDGKFGFNLKDVWELSLSGTPSWTELSASGGPPNGLHGSAAVYDPVRDRLLVFGGLASASPFYPTDVWALSLAGTPTWSMVTTIGGPTTGRYGHSAIYDPIRDRMIVFGGWDGTANLNDTWALSLSGPPTWNLITPVGSLPPGRREHTAIYDPTRDRMVVFAGWNDASASRNDAWVISLSGTPAWTDLGPTGTPPRARYRASAVYDPDGDRMIVFGGGQVFGDAQTEAWSLAFASGADWILLLPTSNPPEPRNGACGVYDSHRDRLIVVAGEWAGDTFFNDVWALSLSGGQWTKLAPIGTPPSRRRYHTGIYDPVRDRIVIFSGADEGSLLNDVWELSLAATPTWTRLQPAAPLPLNRYGSQAIYDPVRDRMLVFGGFGDGGFYNDVWALLLSGVPTWTQLAPTGALPPGREFHGLVYDPVRDRMITLAGDAAGIVNDVWAMSLAGVPHWEALSPSGTPPSPRSGLTATYDQSLDRIVVFGGGSTGNLLVNDLWALSLAGMPAWQPLSAFGTYPSGRYRHCAVGDPVRGQVIVFGGDDESGDRHDVWAFGWNEGSTDVPVQVARATFELSPAHPNPFAASVAFDLSLPRSSTASLTILSVTGAVVRRLARGALAHGEHRFVWNGLDMTERRAPNGIYFARLQIGEEVFTRKATLIR